MTITTTTTTTTAAAAAAWALAVAALWGVYPLVLKGAMTRVDPVDVWAIMSIVAALVSAAVLTARGSWRRLYAGGSGLTARDAASIVLAAVLGPVLGFWLLLRALAAPGAQTSTVMALAYTAPVVAALLGWLWWGERLGAAQAAGIACVCAGVLILLLRRTDGAA